MILFRAALIKIFQTVVIGALSVGVIGCLLLSYCYLSGDRQDRREMLSAVDGAKSFFNAAPERGKTTTASYAPTIEE